MASRRLTDAEILAQIPAAVARAARSRRTKPHAESARFDRRSRALHVRLTNGVALAIPVALVPSLAKHTDADLSHVVVGPAGLGLHWERLDVDLSVAALARVVLGARTLMQAAGAAGGSSRSPAKSDAARENGKKGGRPKKRASLLR